MKKICIILRTEIQIYVGCNKSPPFSSHSIFSPKFLNWPILSLKPAVCSIAIAIAWFRCSIGEHCNIEFNGIVCTVVSSTSMHCKSILGLVDTHYDLVCRTEVFGKKLKFCQTILTLSAFVISFSVLSEDKLKVHVHAVYRKTSYFAVICFIVHTIEMKSLKIGSQQSFFPIAMPLILEAKPLLCMAIRAVEFSSGG